MDVSLKKARKIESKIGMFINNLTHQIDVSTPIRVNEDPTNINVVVNDARQAFFNEFDNLNNLIEARQEIRNLIAEANHKESVNTLIAEKVLLESKLSKINKFIGFGLFDNKEVEDTLEYSKKALENGERFASTVKSISFLSKIDEDKFKKDKQELIKKIEELEDKLGELNHTCKIGISANTVKLLKDNLLI